MDEVDAERADHLLTCLGKKLIMRNKCVNYAHHFPFINLLFSSSAAASAGAAAAAAAKLSAGDISRNAYELSRPRRRRSPSASPPSSTSRFTREERVADVAAVFTAESVWVRGCTSAIRQFNLCPSAGNKYASFINF